MLDTYMRYHKIIILSILLTSLSLLQTGCRQNLEPNQLDAEAITSLPILKGQRSSKAVVLFWNWVLYDLEGFRSITPPQSFQILVSEMPNEEGEVIDEVDGNTSVYTIEGLENDKIYFFRIRATSNFARSSLSNDIMIMPSEVEEVSLVFPTNNINRYWGSWSSDGESIVYESVRRSNFSGFDTISEVYTYNLNSGQELFLATGKTPDWSPDGSKIAFHSHNDLTTSPAIGNNDAINIYQTNNESLTQLTTSPIISYQLNWAPDNSTIAFFAKNLGANDYDIYQFDTGVGNTPKVVNNLSAGIDPLQQDISLISPQTPAWSPDGFKIVFSQGTKKVNGFLRQIYSTPVQGGAETLLIESQWNDESPVYSPNGEYLAFISDRTGDKAIWLLHLPSQTYKQLTGVPVILPVYQNGKLDWSPDGTKILFSAFYENTDYLTLFSLKVF